MIYNFYFTSLIFLAGICLFSAVNHFTTHQPRQQRRVHLLFAIIAISMVLSILTTVIDYNTPTLEDHITWLRLNIAFYIVPFALLPWFFAEYSGVSPKPVLAGSAALCILLFFINLTQPNTLLYSEINGIDRLLLPWGEEVFLPEATPSIWGDISSAYVLLVPVFAFYVLVRRFRRDRRRSTLSMMVAVVVLMSAFTEAVIVRIAGIHNLPPLGAFGFLSMVIIMGITLTHELREDHKLAEEALLHSEHKSRAILDQSIQFIGLLSPDGILLDANRAALELIGVTSQDVYNKPFWESPWWNHSTELQNKLRESIKSAAAGDDIRFEASHPAKDGSLRYVDFSLRPVKNEQGDILYLIPEGHDITERKLAEENLMESQRKLTTLMSNLPGLAYRCKNDPNWTMIRMENLSIRMMQRWFGRKFRMP
jgi:PAS domain S-box-containing protein